MEGYVVVLAGNPNVGKSTLFNGLTGMNQHTGNWTGKTVSCAQGKYQYNGSEYKVIDLPGTYSLEAVSEEEKAAREYICKNSYDVAVVVCDATCLERNLYLALQMIDMGKHMILCINLMDEAKKKKIVIDKEQLELLIGVPVIFTSARNKKSLYVLMKAVEKRIQDSNSYMEEQKDEKRCEEVLNTRNSEKRIKIAEYICREVVHFEKNQKNRFDRKLDKILTDKWTGIPIMLMLLSFIFWITIVGANVPSQILFDFFYWVGQWLERLLETLNSPVWLTSLIVEGIYKVLTWIISVMLPPMAIFFPLFTLLEDFGYLPRIAFNLDKWFHKANACGKQCLTMCMGLGCNAVGVCGCRIIDSKRERMIAILTNSFMPCNGRFPTLISIITMFFAGVIIAPSGGMAVSFGLTAVIVFCIFLTLMISKLLSATILKGYPSGFVLELPPYRRPQIGKVLIRSVCDRTLFVLGRAIIVAAPAGLVIWIMANVAVGDRSLLNYCSGFLDPFARLMGLDGTILLAFILGFPANEIVIPIILMAYLNQGSLLEIENLSELKHLLIENGWSTKTAICMILFCLVHWPCGTTCLTIRKETNSMKWTGIAILLPFVLGVVLCMAANLICTLFGIG